MENIVAGASAVQMAPAPTPAPAPSVEPAVQPQEPAVQIPAATIETPPANTIETPPANNEPRYVLRTNERTGRRELFFENGTPPAATEQVGQEPPAGQQEQVPAVESIPAQTQEQTPAPQPTMQEAVQQAFNGVDPNAVQPYNLAEFSQALATNTVDERRVPEQFRDKYVEHTIQKAQQEYDAFVAEQQRQRQQVEQQLNQKPDPEKQKAFYAELNAQVRAAALADLGISEADFKAKEFEDETIVERFEAAKDWHRTRLINELQAKARGEEAARAQQANIIGQIQAYVKEQRAKEPHFDEIDRMMGTLYQELPYNKAAVIAGAIAALRNNTIKADQLPILQEYYEIGRRMYYAKKNGLQANQPQQVAQQVKPQPPMVETPGNGTQNPKLQGVNETDLRNARNARERNNILYALLNNRIKR